MRHAAGSAVFAEDMLDPILEGNLPVQLPAPQPVHLDRDKHKARAFHRAAIVGRALDAKGHSRCGIEPIGQPLDALQLSFVHIAEDEGTAEKIGALLKQIGDGADTKTGAARANQYDPSLAHWV